MDAIAINKGTEQKKIFKILFKEDEVTWKSIIMNLIHEGQMDPWDINLSQLADEFLKTLKAMKEFDFRISGKIILAASFFLKIKSDKLLNEDLATFDDLLNPQEEEFLEIMDEIETPFQALEKPVIRHKSPRPRKRQVSVYDLIGALENALENTYKKSFKNKNEHKMTAPKQQKDITQVITELFDKIQDSFKRIKKVTFTQLAPSDDKEVKVNTFIPLLYLDNQRKVDLVQDEHFGEIQIKLTNIRNAYLN